MASRVQGITIFEEEEISWGEVMEPTLVDTIQLCRQLEMAEEEKVQTLLNRNDPPSEWKSAIEAIVESGIKVGYSDGSLEEGQVGAG